MRKMLSIGLLNFLLLVTFVGAQEKPRIIKDVPLHPNSPIHIVDRELNGNSFDAGRSVIGRKDWLKSVAFTVKNVSNKNIIYFNINLTIPRQGKMPGSSGMEIYFGSRKALSDKILRPGEIVEVKIREDELSYWETELKKYEVEDLAYVMLDIRTVHFDDGTGWQLGIATGSQ